MGRVVIRDPQQDSSASRTQFPAAIDKGKGILIDTSPEPIVIGTKCSIQTAIDLHNEEIDRLVNEEMSFFDD